MERRRQRAAPMTADERRTAIVEAVLPLVERHGGDVTTRQIAEAAGIAEGTIFRVFADKRSLILAAAEQTVAPVGWREEMETLLAEHPDLRSKVRVTAERMVERTRKVVRVMTALRGAFFADGPHPKAPRGTPPGPPRFLIESGRQLHEALTELVFEPHRDELSVPPDRAARAMRSLVMGTWHPGSLEGEQLSIEEITDLLLHGIEKEGR